MRVVGRLVQQQQVDRPDQRRRQRHTLALAARERADVLVKRADPQARQHVLGLVFGRIPHIPGEAVEDLLEHGAPRREVRGLGQIRNGQPVFLRDRARIRLLDAGHDPEQRGLARAVEAHHAGALARLNVQRRAVQDGSAAVGFADALCAQDARHKPFDLLFIPR